jgi:hypothetical protein
MWDLPLMNIFINYSLYVNYLFLYNMRRGCYTTTLRAVIGRDSNGSRFCLHKINIRNCSIPYGQGRKENS